MIVFAVGMGALGVALSIGTLLGITMGSASIGGITGPTFAGWAFGTLGDYHIIWRALSGLSALTIWLMVRVR